MLSAVDGVLKDYAVCFQRGTDKLPATADEVLIDYLLSALDNVLLLATC